MVFAYYTHNLSPFLIRFSDSFGIRYYGLAYALGFIGLFFGLAWQARRGWLPLTKNDIADFMTAMIIGVLVGGRLGYCLLYGWEATVHRPLSIFYVWEGGMASHGGILGAIAAILYFARHLRIKSLQDAYLIGCAVSDSNRKLDYNPTLISYLTSVTPRLLDKSRRSTFYSLADATALCTPLALALGRGANFINGELWGRPSSLPWAVIFPEAPLVNGLMVPRHPSQLYEGALEGILLFGLLLILRLKTKREGVVALTFMAGYAVLRIVGECFREPDSQIGFYAGGLTQGQLLSVGMLAATAAMAWFQWGRKRRE